MVVLNVHVREQLFSVKCKAEKENFKWLGLVASYRYARSQVKRVQGSSCVFPSEVCPESFLAINIFDHKKRVLFPAELVGEKCKDGDHIYVEVLGPNTGSASTPDEYVREVPLWERYAYTAAEQWVAVVFYFDATGMDLQSSPAVTGNFNGWSEPIRMKLCNDDTRSISPENMSTDNTTTPPESNSQALGSSTSMPRQLYKLEMTVPAYSDIVFKFVIDGAMTLSDSYDLVTDSSGQQMNYFCAVPSAVPSHAKDDTEDVTLQLPDKAVDYSTKVPKAVSKRLSPRVTGAFEGVKSMDEEMRMLLFEQDWKKMQFCDVVRRKAEREKIKSVLRVHFEDLRRIFQYFSSVGSGAITFMSGMEFLHLCHVCQLPGPKLTVRDIDRVFHRVNIEEVFDEKMIEENPNNYRNAMKIVPDPYNPDHQFIRGEFMEALVRLALLKYKNVDVDAAVQKLLTKDVLPNSLTQCADSIREELLDPDVQRVYRQFAKKLHNLYVTTAKSDKEDLDHNTISVKEFENMLKKFNLCDQGMSLRAAMSAFALSQNATLDDEENYRMVYPEFLEALGRIAKEKYSNAATSEGAAPAMPLCDRLHALFTIIFHVP